MEKQVKSLTTLDYMNYQHLKRYFYPIPEGGKTLEEVIDFINFSDYDHSIIFDISLDQMIEVKNVPTVIYFALKQENELDYVWNGFEEWLRAKVFSWEIAQYYPF